MFSTVMAGAPGAREPPSGHVWDELRAVCRHPLRLLVELVTRVYQDDLLTLAAALAYYFFFSLFRSSSSCWR